MDKISDCSAQLAVDYPAELLLDSAGHPVVYRCCSISHYDRNCTVPTWAAQTGRTGCGRGRGATPTSTSSPSTWRTSVRRVNPGKHGTTSVRTWRSSFSYQCSLEIYILQTNYTYFNILHYRLQNLIFKPAKIYGECECR